MWVKRIVIFFLIFLFFNIIFSFTFEAKLNYNKTITQLPLTICYQDSYYDYSCYYYYKFPLLINYSLNSVSFLDKSKNLIVQLSYIKTGIEPIFVFRDFGNYIYIGSKDLIFTVKIYLKSNKSYLFLFNNKIIPYIKENNTYIVYIYGPGTLKIVFLNNNVNVFEAKIYNYSQICLNYPNNKECYSISNYPYGILTLGDYYTKINDPLGNQIILNNFSKFGAKMFLSYVNDGNKVNFKLNFTLIPSYLAFSFNTSYLPYSNYIVLFNNESVNYSFYDTGNITFLYIEVPSYLIKENNNLLIQSENVPVVILKENETILTNESQQYNSYYDNTKKELIIVDKDNNMQLKFVDVNLISIPEVAFYIKEKSADKVVIEASVIKGLSFKEAILSYYFGNNVRKILKYNGSTTTTWNNYKVVNGYVQIYFTESDPVFTILAQKQVQTDLFNIYSLILILILFAFFFFKL
ncbi:MAG: hypothetical protein ABGW69_00795 [Nanoarchaeota archaeon]